MVWLQPCSTTSHSQGTADRSNCLLVQNLKALGLEMAHIDLQETKGENAAKYYGVNKSSFAEAD